MDGRQADIQLTDTVKIAKIEVLVEDMHARLFGNGQPGLLKEIDQRLDILEHSKAKMIGGITVISAIASWAGWEHLRELFARKP